MLVKDSAQDQELYKKNPEKYVEIHKWLDQHVEAARVEFMGEEFANGPKFPKHILEEQIRNLETGIAQATSTAPAEIIEYQTSILNKMKANLENGWVADPESQEDAEYMRALSTKLGEFHGTWEPSDELMAELNVKIAEI
jgi:hypothetical protein